MGDEQIDNYLRQAMNIAFANGARTEKEAQVYVLNRLDNITSWPSSPQPNAFPFTQAPGIQLSE